MTLPLPSSTEIQQIWQKHRLGDVYETHQPRRGSINHCLIINDAYVMRFDVLNNKGATRFQSENIAYETLSNSDLPVPWVIALDESREIVPYEYLITNKLPGTPVIDGWHHLSDPQKQTLSDAIGTHLAKIHEYKFDGWGKLHHRDAFPSWFDYVHDYLNRYAQQALALGVMDHAMWHRIEKVWEQHQPVLRRVEEARLIHSDFQFENILHQGEAVTGMIDFEWAFCGDPVFDFVPDNQWEETCPGSSKCIYAAYRRHHPIDTDWKLRLNLYKLASYVECMVDFAERVESAAHQRNQKRLMRILATLEGHR